MLNKPATISEISNIKYPCNNQSKLVIKMRDNEKKDKSFTLLVTYVLYNWGNNFIELNIGANVAIIIGIIIYLLYKNIGVLYE
jgi:hypothetical protein